jgi:hypothetical protein
MYDDGLTLLERRRRLLGQGGNNKPAIKNAPLADISRNGAIRVSKQHTIRTNTTAPSQPNPPQFPHQQHNQSLIHRQGPPVPLKRKIKTHNKPSLPLADSTDSDDDFIPESFIARRVVTNQLKQQPDNVKKITTATALPAITTNHSNNHNPPTTTTQRAIVPNPTITITIPPKSSSHPIKLIQQGHFGQKHIQTITTDPKKKKKKSTTTTTAATRTHPHRGLQPLKNTNEEAEAIFSNRINLDKQPMSKWPGWCRFVQPYLPSNPTSSASSLLSDRKVIYTPDIMSSFSDIIQSHSHNSQPPAGIEREGREGRFQGILLNIPQLSNCAGPGRITSTQLTTLLPLGDRKVLSTGILCIWAKKGSQIKEVFRCLKGWGFTYVENLTWVQLTPAGKIVVHNNMERDGDGDGDMYKNAAANTTTPSHINVVACSSHKTLIMAKKQSNKETLELRHQRTCDVLLSPHLGGHQVPDDVRLMLETLLPDAGTGGISVRGKKKMRSSDDDNNNGGDSTGNGQQPLRLLELAFQGPDLIETGRRGWFKIIQQQGGACIV